MRKSLNLLLIFISLILLALANDLNPNPGPATAGVETAYLCGTYDNPITWDYKLLCVTHMTNGIMLTAKIYIPAHMMSYKIVQLQGIVSSVTA